MSKRLVLVVVALTLLTSLIIVASALSQSTIRKTKVLVDDMNDEVKQHLKRKNIKRKTMERPKECVCSQPISAENNKILRLDPYSGFVSSSGAISNPQYLINCQCGNIQCVLTNQVTARQDTFCFKK